MVEALVGANIGAVVVGDKVRVIGIISERDVMHALSAGGDLGAMSAMDVAHTNLIWCDVTATVAEVAGEMIRRYVRHVLVEQDGHLVGIVSQRDLSGCTRLRTSKSSRRRSSWPGQPIVGAAAA